VRGQAENLAEHGGNFQNATTGPLVDRAKQWEKKVKRDWATFLARLHAYTQGVHAIGPPVLRTRLDAVEEELGKLPSELVDMLDHFNGAELFIWSGPMLTMFGLSEASPVSKLKWAENWYIDKFTPKWRAAGDGRESQFAIGMTNYGGLILFENGRIREWDTAQREWAPSNYELSEWLEKVLHDGEVFLRELNSH
jgi:hypothetical protein